MTASWKRPSLQVWRGGFATREEAWKERDRLRNAANRGTSVGSSKMTVGEYLEDWLRGHEVSLKPSTGRSYRANLDRDLLPAIGRERLIEVNPVVGTKRPRAVKPKHRTWSAEELRAFLGSLPADHRWTTLWELAAGTGMRRGEMLALRWSDIDLDNGLLRVERSVFHSAANRSYGRPKNHERREIVLDARLAASLRSWRKTRLAERMALGADRDEEDLVFTWEDGRPVPPDHVTTIFRRLTSQAEVPRLRFHELRHTHATLLLRE